MRTIESCAFRQERAKRHPKLPHAGLKHKWRAIGAHILVGRNHPRPTYPDGRLVYPDSNLHEMDYEIREVFVCERAGCKEVRVKIRQRREVVAGVSPETAPPTRKPKRRNRIDVVVKQTMEAMKASGLIDVASVEANQDIYDPTLFHFRYNFRLPLLPEPAADEEKAP